MTSEKMTFIKLLEKYTVVIPKIQRDYAQGRTDPHAAAVREKLLKDIKNTLSKKTHLDLNFVYGSIEKVKEKDKDEKTNFIPIDGQQRLTTLFLLHLYAFRNDESKTDLLKKFTYKTRASSRKFIEYIVDNRGEFFKTNPENPIPSDLILDSSDYVESYNCDPTVKSMLQMLDDIYGGSENDDGFKNIENLDELLKGDYITFNFLEIDNLASADDLYIKLNARGKPLTNFENFKASLLGAIRGLNKEQPCIPNDFESLFDSNWTDFFWKEGKEKYEDDYFTLFKILFFNYNLVNKQTPEINDLLRAFDEGDKTAVKDVILSAYYLLKFLCDKNNNGTDAYKLVMDALKNPNAINHLAFHTISVFLIKQKGNAATIKDWARVLRNLINNNTIIDRYDKKLTDAIKDINDFSNDPKHLTDILNNMPKDLSGFDSEQLKEEQEKAKIIIWSRTNNSAFENAIYDAEKLEFFGGQIRVALYPAKDNTQSCGYNLQNFNACWEKAKFLFNDYDCSKDTLPDEELIRRALLSIGDYTLEISVYKTLLSVHTDTNSVKSLKLLFSYVFIDSAEKEKIEKGKIAQTLLSNLNTSLTKERALEDIINKNKNNVKPTDWRYCFIEYPNLFKCFKLGYYRIREITVDYNGYILKRTLIIPKQEANGVNVDIFLGALKAELIKRGKEVKLDHDEYTECGKGASGNYFIICSDYRIADNCLDDKFFLEDY